MPAGPLHRVERGLRLLEGVGIDVENAEPVVPASDADREAVDAFLAECHLQAGQFAVIHAGTSEFGSYKQWPADRWAAVASRLRDELGLCVVLTRGPSEAEGREAQGIAMQAAADALVAPLLSLTELAELSRRCRLFLSPDTGPMHLASAVGAPVVALFGPKDPSLYGPYFSRRAIVEKDLECRPCRKRSCDDPRCMLAIEPDDVMEAVARVTHDA
jgi:ADP-heptose:LPS heptosyltransferase